MNDTSLTHWGVKGMKWGVRRYQNKDGSLTAAGKKRYGDSNDQDKGKKKSLSVAKIAVAGALVAIGGYSISKLLNNKKEIFYDLPDGIFDNLGDIGDYFDYDSPIPKDLKFTG